MEHLNMQTPDGAHLNLDALYQICPSCFTESADAEGKLRRAVNWNKLRELLGDYAEENAPESYDFTWVGKRAAQREAAAPINKTLRPCPEESVDWENTQNLYIEGDNLEVLKLLQNSYMGKVKMIYIDPPYNTGKEFIYHDNACLSKEELDLLSNNLNQEGNRYFKNMENGAHFHSKWCSNIFSRLSLAKSLLAKDGVIFISIDDHEVENLKKIGNEVFGEYNFVGQWNWFKSATPPNLSKKIKKNIEYILCWKGFENKEIFRGVQKTSSSDDPITKPQNTFKELLFKKGIINCKFADGIYPAGTYGTSKFPNELLNDLIVENGKNANDVTFRNRFIWLQDKLNDEINAGTKINLSKSLVLSYKKAEYSAEVPPNFIDESVGVDTTEKAGADLDIIFGGKTVFDYPKPCSLVEYLLNFTDSKDYIAMDFYSGSGTTGHSVFNLNTYDQGNRKVILVQWPEDLCESYKQAVEPTVKQHLKNAIDFLTDINKPHLLTEIGKERIRRAGAKIKAENPNVDTGFRVFKCDTSNMKEVYFAPKDYSQDLLSGLEENIKEDRTDLDLLFDCMLRWGVELSLPLSQKKVGACTIHNVNDGDLVACFDGKITEAVIDEIAAMNPLRVVFRDSSFEEASEKMNLFELFKQKCQWSEQEVKNNVRVI